MRNVKNKLSTKRWLKVCRRQPCPMPSSRSGWVRWVTWIEIRKELVMQLLRKITWEGWKIPNISVSLREVSGWVPRNSIKNAQLCSDVKLMIWKDQRIIRTSSSVIQQRLRRDSLGVGRLVMRYGIIVLKGYRNHRYLKSRKNSFSRITMNNLCR